LPHAHRGGAAGCRGFADHAFGARILAGKWVNYFCEGMAESFESVRRRAQEAAGLGASDYSAALRRLDPRQRKALELFRDRHDITSRDVGALFGISQRAARNLLAAWVNDEFLVMKDPAKKSRRYGLSKEFWLG
jgi:predicted HTH transcriptional regulator